MSTRINLEALGGNGLFYSDYHQCVDTIGRGRSIGLTETETKGDTMVSIREAIKAIHPSLRGMFSKALAECEENDDLDKSDQIFSQAVEKADSVRTVEPERIDAVAEQVTQAMNEAQAARTAADEAMMAAQANAGAGSDELHAGISNECLSDHPLIRIRPHRRHPPFVGEPGNRIRPIDFACGEGLVGCSGRRATGESESHTAVCLDLSLEQVSG